MEYAGSWLNESVFLDFNETVFPDGIEPNQTSLLTGSEAPPPMYPACSDHNSTIGDMDPQLRKFYYAYGSAHGYVSAIVSIFGLLANTANIVVLTRKNMHSPVNLILTWLAVADLLTMLIYLPFSVHFYILRDHRLILLATVSQHWIAFLLLFSQLTIIFHTCAIWFTIDLAVFRSLYILLPTRGPRLCTMTSSKVAVFLTWVGVALLAIPNYLSNAIVGGVCETVNEPIYQVHYSQYLLDNPYLFTVNFWIQAILFKLLPCALLTILTILLIHAMNQANKRRMKLKSQGRKEESNRHQETNRTTGMLLAVVVLFLITELPQGILTILSGTVEKFYVRYYTPLGDLMDILALLNNSVNFVLYCAMSRQFRDTFTKIFCKWLPARPEWCLQKSEGYSPQKTNGVSVDNTSQSTEMSKMLLQNNNAHSVA